MFSTIIFVITAVLFLILTPNVMLSLPRKGSKYLIAAVHSILFTSILFLIMMSQDTLWYSNKKESVNNACPSGQNGISGTNKNYGYCSPSTLSDVLSPTSPAPAPEAHTCPTGQNWITGTNMNYGYCAATTIDSIVFASPPSQSIDTSCPSGQSWISGTNPQYGYCSSSTINDVMASSSPSSGSIFDINSLSV